MSKGQNWHFWFNAIEMLNAKGHSFAKEFAFDRGFIAATCTRCLQSVASRYGQEVGPYDTRGSFDVISCDTELEIQLKAEAREEVIK